MKRIFGILTLLFVFLFACGFGQLAKNQQAPNFSLTTKDGKTIELAKLKGKAVLVNFWATWCGPCRAEIPDFIEVYKMYKSKGLEIVGISLDEKGWYVVKPFVESNKMNYPVVLGTQEVVQAYGGIDGIPTTFFVNKNGKIVDQQVGMLTRKQLEEKLKSILK